MHSRLNPASTRKLTVQTQMLGCISDEKQCYKGDGSTESYLKFTLSLLWGIGRRPIYHAILWQASSGPDVCRSYGLPDLSLRRHALSSYQNRSLADK